MKWPARKMAYIALFAALITAFSQISIPIGPVPINLALLAVFAAGGLLTAGEAILSVILFLALGAVGLPVFSGFSAGLGVLAGPTGGYLLGYLPAAFCAGAFSRKRGRFGWYALGMCLGLVLCYVLGTAWFVVSSSVEVGYALGICVFPFLPGDAMKILLASYLCLRVKKSIRSGGITGNLL